MEALGEQPQTRWRRCWDGSHNPCAGTPQAPRPCGMDRRLRALPPGGHGRRATGAEPLGEGWLEPAPDGLSVGAAGRDDDVASGTVWLVRGELVGGAKAGAWAMGLAPF